MSAERSRIGVREPVEGRRDIGRRVRRVQPARSGGIGFYGRPHGERADGRKGRDARLRMGLLNRSARLLGSKHHGYGDGHPLRGRYVGQRVVIPGIQRERYGRTDRNLDTGANDIVAATAMISVMVFFMWKPPCSMHLDLQRQLPLHLAIDHTHFLMTYHRHLNTPSCTANPSLQARPGCEEPPPPHAAIAAETTNSAVTSEVKRVVSKPGLSLNRILRSYTPRGVH